MNDNNSSNDGRYEEGRKKKMNEFATFQKNWI